MFVSVQQLNAISDKGYEDLRAFFKRNFPGEDLWLKAESRARANDANLPQANDVLEFLERFLPWVEQRKRSKLDPWEECQGRLEIRKEDAFIFDLLRYVKAFWLDEIVMPGPYAEAQVSFHSPHGSNKFWRFVKFIGEEQVQPGIPWRVFYNQKLSGMNFYNFVSWLIVSPASATKPYNTLHVFYDEQKIGKSLCHRGELVTRFEKIILHELGHARTELPWYIARLQAGDRQAESHPFHELEAWAYALAIRSFVTSTRSWLSRILSNADNEYMSP